MFVVVFSSARPSGEDVGGEINLHMQAEWVAEAESELASWPRIKEQAEKEIGS